jgi:hypothetical protein
MRMLPRSVRDEPLKLPAADLIFQYESGMCKRYRTVGTVEAIVIRPMHVNPANALRTDRIEKCDQRVVLVQGVEKRPFQQQKALLEHELFTREGRAA